QAVISLTNCGFTTLPQMPGLRRRAGIVFLLALQADLFIRWSMTISITNSLSLGVTFWADIHLRQMIPGLTTSPQIPGQSWTLAPRLYLQSVTGVHLNTTRTRGLATCLEVTSIMRAARVTKCTTTYGSSALAEQPQSGQT